MRRIASWGFVALAAAHLLAAPLIVLCHARGPDGHTRYELAMSDCCAGHRHDAPASCGHEASRDAGESHTGCGECTDEQVRYPQVAPRSSPVPSDSCLCDLPSCAAARSRAVPTDPRRSESAAHDPPVYLLHRALLL